jgi:fluoride ion exporter CrcB/FEX
MIALAFVALAAIGTLARWQLARFNRPGWAAGTFAVNIGAAFVLGLLHGSSPDTLTLAGVALLGSYSTFSTIMGETTETVESGGLGPASAYLAITVMGGVLAAYVGLQLA